MRLTVDVVIDRKGKPHVFFKPAPVAAEFSLIWELWEKPELAREITFAIAAAIDALQGEADETMRRFFRTSTERIAEERRLDEQARREEWA